MDLLTKEEEELYNAVKKLVKPNDLYYHHKNPDKHYKILSIAIHGKNKMPSVVYQSEETGIIWIKSCYKFFKNYLRSDILFEVYTKVDVETDKESEYCQCDS